MKVGDYVRTNLRNEIVIRKVVDIIHRTSMNDNRMVFDKPTKFTYYVEDNKNYKSSPNIMDLIEYEDIIKYKMGDEEYISEVWGEKNDYFVQEFGLPMDLSKLNIVSIVTHEQFSQMEYRIGE